MQKRKLVYNEWEKDMRKKITIYKGDEYRAKIERIFEPEDIFSDVYTRAVKIVNKIISEMQEYDEQHEAENANGKSYTTRYMGMGNNIVFFCGTRGQGKTSAMQTFANCLEGKYKEEETHKLPGLPEDSFEVLGTIDPSAMENGESILRVLLSRLFFQLQERITSGSLDTHKGNDFAQRKADIVKLFQKCYANIDYIKSGKNEEYERDDLENLSQLGSSAKLKENLHDLIAMYLRMVSSEKGEKNVSHKYLVIPVDDADLATKKVFKLCEDIRNYLSIPNVIILMAADYDQLVHAAYLKYLKQYKVRLNAAEKESVVDDCHEMAAKYIEKVFPAGHRIDLPQIDYLLAESYEEIKFEYRIPDENHKGKFLSAFQEVENFGNIQEQILRLLYIKTGIVLINEKEAMHVFLPHTFRELTHFVKLLYDMPDINCDEVYRNYEQGITYFKGTDVFDDWNREVQLLKENILMVKQYFLNYWCEKNLSAADVRAVHELDDANQRHQMVEVCAILKQCFGRSMTFSAKTYGEILRNVTDEKIKEKPRLQEAVSIYYTIFLNGWFAAALEKEEQFYEIAKFVGKAIDVSDEFLEGAYIEQFYINQFIIEKEDLEQIQIGFDSSGLSLGKALDSIESARNFLEACCTAGQRKKSKRSISLFKKVRGKVYLNPAMDILEFNILKPILNVLINGAIKENQEEVNHTSLGEQKVNEKSAYITGLISLRNIIANCDMQMYLRDELDKWYEKINAEGSKVFRWLDIWKALYEAIDDALETVIYSKSGEFWEEQHEIFGIYESLSEENKDLMNALFLCNKNNRLQYIKNRSDATQEWLNKVDSRLKSIRDNYSSDDMGKKVSAKEDIIILLNERELIALPDGVERISIGQNDYLAELKKLQKNMTDKVEELKKIYLSEEEKTAHDEAAVTEKVTVKKQEKPKE